VNPKSQKQKELLEEIKGKSVLLTQQIDVNIDGNGVLVIDPKTLIRSGNGGKQDNHIIPVAMFLSSIKYHLKRQNDISKVFDNLSYIYNLLATEVK